MITPFSKPVSRERNLIVYNRFFSKPEQLVEFIRLHQIDKTLKIDDTTIKFLLSLYQRKLDTSIQISRKEIIIPAEILADILYEFCEYFNINRWKSYRLFYYRKTKPHRRISQTFLLLPLTMGEYVSAVKTGEKLGYFRKEKVGNGKNRRYIWEVVRDAGTRTGRVLERCNGGITQIH